MLVREEKERLRLYATKRSRDSWSVIDKPVWELAVEPDSELLLPDSSGGPARDVFVLEGKQILCVRLR